MVELNSLGELCKLLECSPRRLYYVADHIDRYVDVFEIIHGSDPRRKPRIVYSPKGALRSIQTRLLRDLFRPRLHPSRHSFGGIPGRNAQQNASQHVRSRFVYTTDIENFFPSISAYRLRDALKRALKCTDEIAWLITRLCSFQGHLSQGLITSPILADYAVRRVDARIAGICSEHNLTYSRFVDDLTISGWFELDKDHSGIVALTRRIICECGYRLAVHKEASGSTSDGDVTITGLRPVRGRLDVAADYLRRLEFSLDAHIQLAQDGEFNGPYFTEDQLRGRVEYVSMINAKQAQALRRRLRRIDWKRLAEVATERGLVRCEKTRRLIELAV